MSDEVQKIAVDSLIEYFEKNEGFEKIYQEIELHKTTKTLFKSNVLSGINILELLLGAEEREVDSKKSRNGVKFLETKISEFFIFNNSNSNWL